MRALVVVGTRPEAIKLWPVVNRLNAVGADVLVCATGQQPDLLAQTLPTLGIRPSLDLRLASAGYSPTELVAAISARIEGVVERHQPDWVIVQGDTSSALAASLAAHAANVRLAHVEAGLRTFDFSAPWPEEQNRCRISRLADIHFAPTQRAATNLLSEGISEELVSITGNTAIDALQTMIDRLDADPRLRAAAAAEIGLPHTNKRLIVVTAHRRENFPAFHALGRSLNNLAARGDVEIAVPVHPNPGVTALTSELSGTHGITLLRSLSYPACLVLMRRAALLITDSGGLQEEAPSLGLPVLVTRVSTERQEALECGAARIVTPETLCATANDLLDDPAAYNVMAQVRSPFGDGRAAFRIVDRIIDEETKISRNRACFV